MTVECDAGVARHLLDALEDLAGQDLADVALAELRTLGVVVLVQLKWKFKLFCLVIKVEIVIFFLNIKEGH